MGQKIWRRWRHGPHTAIFQNSGLGGGGGGGGGWGVSHTRTPPPRDCNNLYSCRGAGAGEGKGVPWRHFSVLFGARRGLQDPADQLIIRLRVHELCAGKASPQGLGGILLEPEDTNNRLCHQVYPWGALFAYFSGGMGGAYTMKKIRNSVHND